MITKKFKRNVMTKSMFIGTGFYSFTAYDALMLINCLEAGCYVHDELSKDNGYDLPREYCLDGWATTGRWQSLPRNYVAFVGGKGTVWANTEVIRDYSTGEIVLHAELDSNKFALWDNSIEEPAISRMLSKGVRSAFKFVEPLVTHGMAELETEGTCFLNPYSFFGEHVSPRQNPHALSGFAASNEELSTNFNWNQLLSRNYGRPTYKHKVSFFALSEIFNSWWHGIQPEPILMQPMPDPFRLQVEKDIYDEVNAIKRQIFIDAKQPGFLTEKDKAEPRNPETFYRILERYESKQRALIDDYKNN